MTKYLSAKKKIEVELIKKELVKYDTISAKLDFLFSILNNQINPELKIKIKFHGFFKFFKRTHFDNDLNNSEFTNWFLKYNSQTIFISETESDFFNKLIPSKLKKGHVQGLLHHISKIENKANKYLQKGKIDYFKTYRSSGFLDYKIDFDDDINKIKKVDKIDCIEYLRVNDGYYETHPTEHDYLTIRSPEVIAYYRHKLLKPYLKSILNNHNKESLETTKKDAKIYAKHYALYHWILIEMGKENFFEYNRTNSFPKAEIIQFSKNRYPNINAQSFYVNFKDIDIKNKKMIANSFGKNYKEKIISLSGDNIDVIKHLKKFPNK